jgi:hypothetical protein
VDIPNGKILGRPKSYTGFCHQVSNWIKGPDLHNSRGKFSQLPVPKFREEWLGTATPPK